MKEDEIYMLHSINKMNLSDDYLTSLSKMIEKNNPSDKWKDIIKELNGICLDINNSKTYFSRVYEEMKIQAELNYYIKDKKPEEVLNNLRNYDKLLKENKKLKQNIK